MHFQSSGKCIVPINKIVEVLWTKVTCKRCVLQNHKKIIKEFLDFCKKYEENVDLEEATLYFRSQTDQLEWSLFHHKKFGELYQMLLAV